MEDEEKIPENLREVPASEILAKIKEGEPVEYEYVVVKDDLDNQSMRHEILLSYRRPVNSEIKITNSKIEGKLNFANSAFLKPVDFSNTEFCIHAQFENSKFSCNVKFWKSIFSDGAGFKNSVFVDNANFSDSKFNKFTDFGHAEFRNHVGFMTCEFIGKAYFRESVFGSDANFMGSVFSGEADFVDSVFRDEAEFFSSVFNDNAKFAGSMFSTADFIGAEFEKDGVFDRSQFGYADFIGSKFVGYARFKKARFFVGCKFSATSGSKTDENRFKGDANFNDSQFNQSANFSDSQFCGSVDFKGAQFNKDVIFDNANFKGKLSLNRTKYEKMYIRWKSITITKYQWKVLENYRKVDQLDYDDAAYLLLIENFKNLGLFEDADNIYYLYRTERRRNLPTLYKPIDWLLWLFYGYSVKPLRPLGWLVLILLAFGLLYSVAGHSPMEAFNTSLTLSLSGTQLIENPNHPVTAMQYWIFTSEKLLASLFFAMSLVSVGRTIIR